MSETTPDSPTRWSPIDLARRVVRMTLSRGVRAAATPARALARLGRDEADPRWAQVSWLWQPGWGRHAHDRLYRNANPYGIDTNPYERQKYATVMETLAYHYRGAFGQVNSADNVHDRLGALAANGVVHRLVAQRLDGVGPGGAGVRFDVVATAPVPSVPVTLQGGASPA